MTDLKAAMDALGQTQKSLNTPSHGATSDLSIDEMLLICAAGFEPVDLVVGISWWSIPYGAWTWQVGIIDQAIQAFTGAFQDASGQIRDQCIKAGGIGVVGVEIQLKVGSHHVDVVLSGTAVKATKGQRNGQPFISDLSARDFSLLHRAGWWPVGLVAGASFVGAPRRSVSQWAAQKSQNVELPQLTNALYEAREGAMTRMQDGARRLGADGVVAVKLREGLLGHGQGTHILQFIALGTAVRLDAKEHQLLKPEMVVSLDDAVLQFAAENLRHS